MTRNILFFIQSQEIGGVETQLFNLIDHWPDKTDRFTIWCNQGYKGKDYYRSLGIICEPISFLAISEIHRAIDAVSLPAIFQKCFKTIISLARPLFFCVSIIFFWKKLRCCPYDVVFSDNGGYPAAELCLAFIIASKMAGISKRFLMIHSCPSPRRFPFQLLERLLDRIVSRSCSQIVTISHACVARLRELRFEGRDFQVIYNGISPVRMDSLSLKERKKVLEIKEGDAIIGLIGDYEELKGHEFLIRAFVDIARDYQRAKMIFIGSDSFVHAKYLKNLTKELNLEDRIIFTGYLKNAWEYIECFNVLVLPSVAYEGFGFVLLEAMLYNKPVVGTYIGGIPEVIGDAGFLVKPKMPQELADVISRLLKDPHLCAEFGEKGFRRLNDKFTAERMSKEYFELTKR